MINNPESSICLLESYPSKHKDLLLLFIEEISFVIVVVVAAVVVVVGA